MVECDTESFQNYFYKISSSLIDYLCINFTDVKLSIKGSHHENAPLKYLNA